MTPSITESAVQTALGTFLQTILPSSVTVIAGQVNRVASPEGDYVVMWPLRRPRLATNVDTSVDAKFTGSIAGTVMTIATVLAGEMNIGATVFGIGVSANTTVSEQLTGPPGGAGTYTVAPSQTVGSTTLSAGQTEIEQSTEVVYQLDVHGPAAGDNAQTISTLFRDSYGVRQFEGTGVTPLYCDDPLQTPFTTAASQYDQRWTIDMHMQFDPTIAVPAQFADQANVTVISVTEAFPA